MQGPTLKVQRAHGHIDELRRRTSPLDPTLYELRVEKVPPSVIHKNATSFELAYRPKKPIPETLALVIGDAIHNLRAALDHLANGIVREWHPEPPDFGFFPMTKKRENLISHAHLPAIEQALPGTEKLLLEDIRPADGASKSLWAFHSLDNDDKHNLILPTVTFATVSNINVTMGNGGSMTNCGAGSDAARPMVIIHSDLPITVENNLNATVDIKFGDGTPFKDNPVIPTLLQISDVVSETLKAFERLIVKTKFSSNHIEPEHIRSRVS